MFKESVQSAFALVKTDDAMLAPLTQREAAKLTKKLRGALFDVTSAYTFEKEPDGFVSELAWLEAMAKRQAHNREAAKR